MPTHISNINFRWNNIHAGTRNAHIYTEILSQAGKEGQLGKHKFYWRYGYDLSKS